MLIIKIDGLSTTNIPSADEETSNALAETNIFSKPVQVGVDDTGHDVIFYGATSGRYLHWDESADKFIVGTGSFTGATSTHISASDKASTQPFTLETLGTGEVMNNSTALLDGGKQFGDGSLMTGSRDNLRYEISGINNTAGTFNVSVRIEADAKEIAHPSPSKLRPEIFLSLSNFK